MDEAQEWRETAVERLDEILELRATIRERDAEVAQLRGELADAKQAYADMHETLRIVSEGRQYAKLRRELAEARAMLSDVLRNPRYLSVGAEKNIVELRVWTATFDAARALAGAPTQEARMTPADKEAQRRSFAYGNVHLSNPNVTREMVDEAAERVRPAPSEEPRSADG